MKRVNAREFGFLRGAAILAIEPLEYRALLSAISPLDGILAEPDVTFFPAAVNTTPWGYTPAQMRQAYGFSGLTFNNGAVQADGSGQTIAIVDAYNDPNIINDLKVFDQTFGLANPPSFRVVNQAAGGQLPATDAGWAQEIALDVEWAHAMAPNASILLVEANSSSLADLLAAVGTARNAAGVSVVSMSWGSNEFFGETQFDSAFTTPKGHAGVTFIASAGDGGAQALWPAISSNVVAVGGTALGLGTAGGYGSETAWSGSGGGTSRFESEPAFQRGVQSSGARSSPDVSYNASPNTGVVVYDSLAVGGSSGWFRVGGTSAGAPQWAAIFAIANQGRALGGQGSIAGGQTAIYGLPSADFHDIVSGSNGNPATAGYDLVTGRGTPIASSVIRDLVGNATTTTVGAPVATTPTPVSTPAPVTTPTPAPTPVHTRYELVYFNHRWWIIPVTSSAANADDGSGDTIDQSLEGALDQQPSATSSDSIANPATASVFASLPQAGRGFVNAAAQNNVTLIIAPTSTGVAEGVLARSGEDVLIERAPVDDNDHDTRQGEGDVAAADLADLALHSLFTLGASSHGAHPAVLPTYSEHESAMLPALDACLAAGDWADGLEDAMVAFPEHLVASADRGLICAAVGLAVFVNLKADGKHPEVCPKGRALREMKPL